MNFLVVTPVFNGESYILETIKSVLNQQVDASDKLLFIIKDAGSSDKTISIIRNYISAQSLKLHKSNTIIEFFTEPDRGMYDAINQGLAYGNSISGYVPDVFMWLNSDDLLEANAIANLKATFLAKPHSWLIGRAQDIDATGKLITDQPHDQLDYQKLKIGDFNYRSSKWLRAESTAIAYSLIKKVGGFKPELKLAGDYDLFVRLANESEPIYVEYPVKQFRVHDAQMSKDLIKYEYERFGGYVEFSKNYRESHKLEPVSSSKGIIFYPDYTSGNPYQTYLYKGQKSKGCTTFEALEVFLSSDESKGYEFIHIHWLNDIIRREESAAKQMAIRFKEAITKAISSGKKIVFTVHNIASHESKNIAIENDLMHFMFDISYKVHVHHSVVLTEIYNHYKKLPWGKLVIAEHGPYDTDTTGVSKEQLLSQFGLTASSKYIVIPGQIRLYKDFDSIAELHASLKKLGREDIVLLFLGQMHPEITKDKIPKLFNEPNVRRSILRINDAEYNLLTQNAMFTFLSYTKVSTSGSMFHSLSNGTPVLAPAIGTIPCYVGNNRAGKLYISSDKNSIESATGDMVKLIDNDLDYLELRKKTSEVALRLSWLSIYESLFGY